MTVSPHLFLFFFFFHLNLNLLLSSTLAQHAKKKPKHLNFSSMCRQDLIYKWVVFQTFICKLAGAVSRGKHIPSPDVVKA